MNRRNILKVLIDTTFLLPALGVGVEKEAEDVIILFRKIDIYYLEAGLIEAMWKLLKIPSNELYERIRIGIEAIKRTYRLAVPPANAYLEAIKIYNAGHRDYIDALYYTTAKTLNLKFLTIDLSFIEFLKENGYTTELIITPEELEKTLKQQS